jgi:hypothetical protein
MVYLDGLYSLLQSLLTITSSGGCAETHTIMLPIHVSIVFCIVPV